MSAGNNQNPRANSGSIKKSSTNGDRVTVLVPKTIHRELKMKAIQASLTVQDAVHQALVLWMKAK